jgi:tetratricopeptide (TPR) repeat protein
MPNNELNTTLQKLEEQAKLLEFRGNIIEALEKLEEAIKIEKRWYHLYAKASWLYELPDKDINKIWKVVQEGFSRFPEHRFWFLFIRADLRYRAVVLSKPFEKMNFDYSISQLVEAEKDTDSAISTLQESPASTVAVLHDPPLLLPTQWQNININDAIQRARALRSDIKSYNQIIYTTKAVFDAEDRINERIDEQKEQMQSDKIRLIEILGIFTAIMSFIILLGSVAFKATYKEAMPIVGVLALVLILFVTVASLVTSKFYRYRDILKDVRTWLVFLLIIVLGLLVWSSQIEKQNPNTFLINKSQPQFELGK